MLLMILKVSMASRVLVASYFTVNSVPRIISGDLESTRPQRHLSS